MRLCHDMRYMSTCSAALRRRRRQPVCRVVRLRLRVKINAAKERVMRLVRRRFTRCSCHAPYLGLDSECLYIAVSQWRRGVGEAGRGRLPADGSSCSRWCRVMLPAPAARYGV